MPILNYSTAVDSHKTVMEIQSLLARAGALAISVEYTDGEPNALSFVIVFRNVQSSYRLPCRVQGIEQLLRREPAVPKRFKTPQHARRVAWRITKNWCEAQIAITSAGMAEMAEVFLPYAILDNGRTMFDQFEQFQQNQLSANNAPRV